MTAHRTKPTITPERVEWFARYYLREPTWGVFHVALGDGNWDCGAAESWFGADDPVRQARSSWPADIRDAAAWFDSLTPSQRRRLGLKAERRANEIAIHAGYRNVGEMQFSRD